MRTLGLDLASQPKSTAVCMIDWQPDVALVKLVDDTVDDEKLNRFASEADKVGIDIPFGWPDEFVLAVCAPRDHKPWPAPASGPFRYRRMDLFVHREVGFWPLSVSTDRIGIRFPPPP